MIKKNIKPEELAPAPAPAGYNVKPVKAKINSDKIREVLTAIKNREIRGRINEGRGSIDYYEREINERQRDINLLQRRLVQKIRTDLSAIEKSKTISSVFFYRGTLYLTTNPLIFRGNRGENGSADTIEFDGLNIGRVLIEFRPYAATEIRAYGIDWAIGRRTPLSPVVSYSGSICFGNNEALIKKLTRQGKIGDILPYVIKALTRPDYERPYRRIQEAIYRAVFYPNADISKRYLIDKIINDNRVEIEQPERLPEISEYYEITRDYLTKTLPEKYPEIAAIKNICFDAGIVPEKTTITNVNA